MQNAKCIIRPLCAKGAPVKRVGDCNYKRVSSKTINEKNKNGLVVFGSNQSVLRLG